MEFCCVGECRGKRWAGGILFLSDPHPLAALAVKDVAGDRRQRDFFHDWFFAVFVANAYIIGFFISFDCCTRLI